MRIAQPTRATPAATTRPAEPAAPTATAAAHTALAPPIAEHALSDAPSRYLGPPAAELRRDFETTHRVALDGVAVHHVPALADHGVRGLSTGRDILLSDPGDRATLAHELGHVVDVARTGPAAANASVGGFAFADDPAREARADALAAAAGTGAPSAGPMLQPRTGGAALPKLTKASAIKQQGTSDNFDWDEHKTKTVAHGTGHAAEGLGAVLSTKDDLKSTGTVAHGQLGSLDHTVTPAYVDRARPALPAPEPHYRGVNGAYVVPPALLGQAVPGNLLYLPATSLAELTGIQGEMIDQAEKAPVRVQVKTAFSDKELPQRVELRLESLDRVTGAVLHQIDWTVTADPDPSKWVATAPGSLTTAGVKPTTAEWKTRVVWDGVDGLSGDGKHVVADKLGPDHRMGTSPTNKHAASRVEALMTASTPSGAKAKPTSYIAGHLLNDHLGGPGDLAANLAPIPATVNSQMSKKIEEPVKKIVNKERGWVRYEVTISHQDDATAGVRYPSRIVASVGVYDQTGTLHGVNASSIDIPPPSKYAGGGKVAKPAASAKLTGTAIEASPLMLDEVILRQPNDLRPFLKGSAAIFKLIYGSELSAHVMTPEISASWGKIMTLFGEYQTAALTNLNLVATVTKALEAWQRDPVAQQYLMAMTAGDFKLAVHQLYADAQSFADKASASLAGAVAAVKKDLRPADLLKDGRVIALARQLVEHAADNISLLDLVRGQQAGSIPHHVRAHDSAVAGGDHTRVKRERERKEDFEKQPKVKRAKQPPGSPVHVFQEYGVPTHELDVTARYGFEYESERGKRAKQALIALIEDNGKDHYVGLLEIRKLLDLDAAKTSKRLATVLRQAEKLAASRAATTLKVSQQEEEDVLQLWDDTFEALGEKEPEVALALFKALDIKSS